MIGPVSYLLTDIHIAKIKAMFELISTTIVAQADHERHMIYPTNRALELGWWGQSSSHALNLGNLSSLRLVS